jgi:hypothetical protein
MLSRLSFPLILVFWIVMNVLLWRSEFGGRNEMGSAVPVNIVLEKILTAPDDSALEIFHRNAKVGYCRWQANVGEEVATGKIATEDYEPEGRVKRLSSYTVNLEGNFLLEEPGNRLRFQVHSSFTTGHVWKDLLLRVSARPRSWEIKTVAADESISLTVEEAGAKWQRQLKYSELTDPGKLLREFGYPLPPILLNQLSQAPKNLSLGLNWEARNDWFKVGHSKVRVYRLQARLLDRYQAVVIVSRVGEILRVELPNEIVLVNDALINL